MQRPTLERLSFPLLVAAAALAASAAAAEPTLSPAAADDDVRHVRFDDLDLESAAGRAALDRRLNRAIAAICATDPLPASPSLDDARARCVAETSAGLDRAVAEAIRQNRARRLSTAGL
jgi:UrcA family protein